MATENKDESKIVQRCKDRFTQAMDAESTQRQAMSDDLKFVRLGGEYQWDAAAISARQMVGQERPMLTINRIAAFNNQVINEIRQNRPGIKIRPCDDNADTETAEILQGIIRNIESQSNAGIAYETAAASMVDAGLGYIRIISQYVSETAIDEQELVIQRIPDISKVTFDVNSTEPDGSDARWAHVAEDIPKDEFEKEYPDEYAQGWEYADGKSSDWLNDKTVRVCEYYEVKETKEEINLLADGRVLWKSELQPSDQVIKSRKSTRKTVCHYKIGANKILSEAEYPISSIPVIPFIGNEVWTDGKRTIYGLTRHGKSPQQLYNYQSSCEAEYLALSPLSPFMASIEAVQGYENDYAVANKKPLSVLFYNAYDPTTGQPLPRPERQAPAQVPTGVVQAKQAAIDDIKASLGIYDATLGDNPGQQSGKAVLSLQNQASQGTFHYSANAARSIRQCGRVLVEWIPRVYDTDRIMRIIGEDDEIDHVRNSPDIQGAKQETTDERGEIQKIYNLQVGKYDVFADVGASYATKRQESANSMIELVRSYPEIMPIAGDLIVKNLDWAGADAISERMKKMLPPPLQEQEQSPELQQATQQMQQMSQQMEEMGKHIQQLTDDQDLKMLDLAIKQYDAETKRIKTIADIEAGTAPGIEPSTLEIEKHASDMADAEHARQLEIMKTIHQMSMDNQQAQQPPQMQETPQGENAEPVQEPQAQEAQEQ
jgi:hypothetical protein